MHYRITLAYDGTDFEGWQAQSRPTPARTVQGVVEAALAPLCGCERIPLAAAGRTDAGVHALGQVVCFRMAREMAPADLARALNRTLPGDVRVLDAIEALDSFHARRSATSKLYRYVLDTEAMQLPTRRRYAGHTPHRLDRAVVAALAALYAGRHDFASLQSAGGSVKTTERTLSRSDVAWDGTTLVYEVEADGFLRRMVRSLVGGLVAAGRGATTVEALRRALEGRDRRLWPAPAEARGLTLVRVDYPAAVLK